MAQFAILTRDPETAEAQDTAAAIDRGHLARMTFGDRSLEREVLTLFDRQAEILIERMRACDGAPLAALAHTLKGSAASIGAGRVARAAQAVEVAAAAPAAERGRMLEGLAQAVGEARALITELLRDG